jgi:hypothetical protein
MGRLTKFYDEIKPRRRRYFGDGDFCAEAHLI